MRKKLLFWELFPSFLAIIIVSFVATQWSASKIIKSLYFSRTQNELSKIGTIFIEQLKTSKVALEVSSVDPVCDTIGQASEHRYTVVLPSGKVVGDSEKDPNMMDNHGDRPEIISAFKGKVSESRRFSNTLQKWMLYVARPLSLNNEIVAVVRVSVPLADVKQSITGFRLQSISVSLVISAIAGILSIVLSRRISRPLRALTKDAEAFAIGDFERKLQSSPVAEIDILSTTMNSMANHLNSRIETITRQRDEQDALLFCMMESVIAVDLNKNIIRMNRSFRELFGIENGNAMGRQIEEVIRNLDLHTIINKTLESDELVEGDIYLADRDRFLQAHGTVLNDVTKEKMGALIVLNDVTRLRKLETIRKDFVANVSHELKTPITSIRGFAETLLDGATEKKEDLDRFLNIINKQSQRLQSIIEDLLVLSSIEHDADRNEIELQYGSIGNILDNAVQSCMPSARKKKIQINVQKDAELKTLINIQLLEQAVINLIVNAVKYSEEGTEVEVIGRRKADEIEVSVADQGSGIAAKHLARLFERFYRVDKSRSRDLGGTGLGLAIVKRVAIAHGGRVTVDSEPGKGSVFTIILPVQGENEEA